MALAAGLRLYRLGEWPPGLYRDEAYNGLDALGVLHGEHHIFFPANNGREPFYIYLVALSIALLGPTAVAVRLPAALIGALATVPTYLLSKELFGRAVGLLAAFLWAITFWPVHLGRIGLRVGALAPLLALAFWLGTRAYRRRRAILWLAAGLVYGLSFYTYLATRFTPLLLALFAVYLVLTGRRERLWDNGRVLWFVFGAALALAPLAAVMARDPSLVFGRAGQVSILSPAISGGDPLGALLGNAGRAVGMYLWRGDTILRHNALLNYDAVLKAENPAGRPVFDLLMVAPFLAGLVWCLRHWRRPAAAFLVLWQLVMLGPTILAEDAPHFLRAAGVLPGAVFFPAIGLALLWDWPRLPVAIRRSTVVLLLVGSLTLTARDYARYGAQPDVAYLWESAAAELARSAATDAQDAIVYLDERFAQGWPSVRFLLTDTPVNLFQSEAGPLAVSDGPAVVYAWPYGPLDLLGGIAPPALVEASASPLARGDLEPEPYSLYTRYAVQPGATGAESLANLNGLFTLRDVSLVQPASDQVEIALHWEPQANWLSDAARRGLPNLFIHVVGPEGMLAQYDGPLGGNLWPAALWQPGLSVGESHVLSLARPFDPSRDEVRVGLYWPDTGERLMVVDELGAAVDDRVIVRPNAAP
jgi:4-amino-4-deoxy-L-arabinose transferase-like glycosyltransferase